MSGGHAWKGRIHGQEACMAVETATAVDGTHPMECIVKIKVLLQRFFFFLCVACAEADIHTNKNILNF